MATNYSPKIPTADLSMLVDTHNSKSWPGSGTTWTDLVGGRSFSSSGTQTPEETKDGVNSFAFNGSGYWTSGDNTSGVDMAGDCTLIIWLWGEASSVRRTIFEKRGTIYPSYRQEIAVTWEVGRNWSYYSRNSSYDYASTGSIPNGEWTMQAIKMSSGKTTTARTGFHSQNGGAFSASYTSRSSSAITPAGNIAIGNGYAGTVETGNVCMVATYNKMLSNDEIAQFYNATKTRFGK